MYNFHRHSMYTNPADLIQRITCHVKKTTTKELWSPLVFQDTFLYQEHTIVPGLCQCKIKMRVAKNKHCHILLSQ